MRRRPDDRRCGATAHQVVSGQGTRHLSCNLRHGHAGTHHWSRIIDGQLESASWIGDDALIGPPQARRS